MKYVVTQKQKCSCGSGKTNIQCHFKVSFFTGFVMIKCCVIVTDCYCWCTVRPAVVSLGLSMKYVAICANPAHHPFVVVCQWVQVEVGRLWEVSCCWVAVEISCNNQLYNLDIDYWTMLILKSDFNWFTSHPRNPATSSSVWLIFNFF